MIANMNITEELKEQLTKREYGEHIYGARKDDYINMSTEQRQVSVKKDKIWKSLNMQEMYQNGMPRAIILFVSELRRSINTTPKAFDAETCQLYADSVSDVRDRAMALKSYAEAKALVEYLCGRYFIHESRYRVSRSRDCVFSKYPSIRYEGYYERKAKQQGIGLSKEEHSREQLENRFEIYLINDSITVNDNRVEVRVSGGISFFYPKQMPVLNKGEYMLTDYSSRNIETFKTEAEAQARKDALVNAYLTAMCANTEDKAKKGKVKFKAPEVIAAKRIGPDYISQYCNVEGTEAHVTGSIMETVLGFDKAQYGNYVSVAGMIDSLDSSFEAALDLATLLNLPKKSVSFNGELGLAFGARGRSDALAHYEPAMKVINITYDQQKKTTKAGCFAHEWAHALDNYLGRMCNHANGLTFATESIFAPKTVKDLVKAMKHKTVWVTPNSTALQEKAEKAKRSYILSFTKGYRQRIEAKAPGHLQEFDELVEKLSSDKDRIPETITLLSNMMKSITGHVIAKGTRDQICVNARFVADLIANSTNTEPVQKQVKTDFLKGSEYFDQAFKKDGNGYWASTVEMFARAFEAYVEDKMKEAGIRSDYLAYNSNRYQYDGNFAVPVGEERILINSLFDKLFDELRENKKSTAA